MANEALSRHGADLPDPAERAGREVQVPAVSRAIAILRLLSTSPVALGVNQIGRALDIIPSTCLHILRTLAAEGLVAVDPDTKQYRLGLQILTLAKLVLKDSIAEQAQPLLDEIVREFGVTAIAVSASGPSHFVVTALSHTPQAVRLHVDLGSRFPALISATGRCVAAYSKLPRRQLKAQFERLRWDHAPDFEEWERQVAQVRERGYAVDDGNYIGGVTIIAAPILGSNGTLEHAIVAVAISSHLSAGDQEALAAALKAAADRIAQLRNAD